MLDNPPDNPKEWMMRIGVVFPQTEIGSDPVAIRDYAQAVEEMGYSHILAYDHVLGAGLKNRPNWRGPYTSATPFHEVFVLLGWLAGLTSRVELVTGVLILPQRQTALVAKQAAEVDVLSGGRMRLGVGTGWNEVEYQALNEDFRNRGARSEEQIAVLRALWAEQEVTFKGKWHTIEDAGILPLPVRRSIPLWLGGTADIVLKRAARLGDGWFPQIPLAEAPALMERLNGYLREAGRSPDDFGIEPRLSVSGQHTPDEWAAFVERWRALGATHMGINTMGAGFASPQQHIDALRRVKDTLAVGQA